MAVTSLEQIKNQACKEVQIQGFEKGEFITLRLKSMSLLGLVSSGKIPNQLMGTAVELFEGKQGSKKGKKEDNGAGMQRMAEIVDIICKNAMLEPTYEEAGEYLNDIQKLEIFYFTQGGINSLESFRKEQGNS